MPRPPKLSPASYLRLLSVGEKGEVSGEPVPPDEPRAIVVPGVGGCLDVSITVRGRKVLRVEADPTWFSREELAWFCRLAKKIADRRKSSLRAV